MAIPATPTRPRRPRRARATIPPRRRSISRWRARDYPVGQNLCFYGEATDPEDGELPASQFEWRADLPNGVTDYLVAQGVKFGSANPTLPGTYTLKLIVTDFDGNQTITTIQFTASNNAPTNQPPTAVAQANPTAGVAPLMVQFNADNSSDPDGTLRYSWDFGDGNTSDKKNPTHTYTNPGTYTAVLTVTDDNCATATDQVTITVNSGTPNPPAAPSNLTATAVSTSQIDLSWTDNSNNEDGFKIERKDPGSTTFVEIAQVGANVTNYSDTGLNPNSTYTYRVRAFNADGNSGYSNEASATTQSQPNPPAAPSNLTATAVSTSQIDLSWTDNSNNEDGFKIERKDPGSTTFVEIAQVGANVTNYSDTGLNPNSTYTYRVRAFNADGNSGYSNEASATTQSQPNPPAAPSNLTATAVSTSQIDLSWTDNSNNEDGFKIERKDPGSTTFVEIAQVGANVTNYSDTGLNPNSTYTYRVRAFNADGNSGYSNEASATTQTQPNPPAAPSNLTATAVSTSQIDLSWTDNSNNEDGFKIERKDPGSTTFVEIAQVGANVTNYSDTGLNPSSTYTYRVRAFNADGNSGYSNEASATTQTPPNQPPTATITQPADGSTFIRWGRPVELSAGDGTDPEDGVLPASVPLGKWTCPMAKRDCSLQESKVAQPYQPLREITLRLIVKDNQGLSGIDEIIIDVVGAAKIAGLNSEPESTNFEWFQALDLRTL
ncbi:MAG: fibronectin type III domain-containing protein [candidate division KSB1 bacterium]|nr:fibronectin type III domain-containing protein [candidate division KSB1 bacterium]